MRSEAGKTDKFGKDINVPSKDDELRSEVQRLVSRVESYAFEKWSTQPKDYPKGYRDVLYTQNMQDELIESILADRKKRELEARISVWSSIKRSVENSSDNTERLLRFNLPEFDVILQELKEERDKL